MTLLVAGNLAITQGVGRMLNEDLNTGNEGDLYAAPSMFAAARIVGAAVRSVYEVDGAALKEQDIKFSAAFIFGGQIVGREARLYMVYAAGNFIEALPETPFLQIGENKYGKPIIDRIISHASSIDQAVKCTILSFDSTMRSNISVAPPIDILTYKRDSLQVGLKVQLPEDDGYLQQIRDYWGNALNQAFEDMPDPHWLK